MNAPIEYPPIGDEPFIVPPRYKMMCCDCGLIHDIRFEAGHLVAEKFVNDPAAVVRLQVARDEAETQRMRAVNCKARLQKTVAMIDAHRKRFSRN
jgi:hypothetical protein